METMQGSSNPAELLGGRSPLNWWVRCGVETINDGLPQATLAERESPSAIIQAISGRLIFRQFTPLFIERSRILPF